MELIQEICRALFIDSAHKHDTSVILLLKVLVQHTGIIINIKNNQCVCVGNYNNIINNMFLMCIQLSSFLLKFKSCCKTNR